MLTRNTLHIGIINETEPIRKRKRKDKKRRKMGDVDNDLRRNVHSRTINKIISSKSSL